KRRTGRRASDAIRLRTRSPNRPAGAEFIVRHPDPAHLRVVGPAPVVVDDRSLRRLVIEIPAEMFGVDPMTRRVWMPARRRGRWYPDLTVSLMLDEIAVLGEHGPHIAAWAGRLTAVAPVLARPLWEPRAIVRLRIVRGSESQRS